MTLSDHTVLGKTELGRNAIAQRLPVLPSRLRPALIMVDGKRSVKELSSLLEAMGGVGVLHELIDLGMLQMVDLGNSVKVAPRPTDAMVPVSGADGVTQSDRLSFPEFKSELRRYFDQELGPSAQMLVIQIEAAGNMPALKPLMARGLDNLKYFKGAGVVEEFQRGLGRRAPQN